MNSLAHTNWNVLTPGYWMLFAMNANGVPSEAHVLQVSTDGIPKITNPGQQFSGENEIVSLTIEATDSDGDTLTYSASNLPPGLSINSGTGEISGIVAEGSTGTYSVEINVTDGESTAVMIFQWVISPQGQGQIKREWWLGIGSTSVSALTGDADYPDNPDGTELLTLFEGPVNWENDYGSRIYGYIHPEVTGDYTFWISSDDNGELWLSTDNDPDNVSLIANVPGLDSFSGLGQIQRTTIQPNHPASGSTVLH